MKKIDYSDHDAAEGLGFAFKFLGIPIACVVILYLFFTSVFG